MTRSQLNLHLHQLGLRKDGGGECSMCGAEKAYLPYGAEEIPCAECKPGFWELAFEMAIGY